MINAANLGNALSALGTTLMGIGIVPQLQGVRSDALLYVAAVGFFIKAGGSFVEALQKKDGFGPTGPLALIGGIVLVCTLSGCTPQGHIGAHYDPVSGDITADVGIDIKKLRKAQLNQCQQCAVAAALNEASTYRQTIKDIHAAHLAEQSKYKQQFENCAVEVVDVPTTPIKPPPAILLSDGLPPSGVMK